MYFIFHFSFELNQFYIKLNLPNNNFHQKRLALLIDRIIILAVKIYQKLYSAVYKILLYNYSEVNRFQPAFNHQIDCHLN